MPFVTKKTGCRVALLLAIVATTTTANAAAGDKRETATFAAGCYWSIELVFQRTPGVLSTRVGFAGGKGKRAENPVYPASGTGHAEAVDLVFDPETVSYSDLLDVFFSIHDPFDAHCQGPDCGPSYRSAVWWHSKEQLSAIKAAAATLEADKGGTVATEIAAAADFQFWPAHEGHQQYLEKMGLPATKGSLEPIQCYGDRGPFKKLRAKPAVVRVLAGAATKDDLRRRQLDSQRTHGLSP